MHSTHHKHSHIYTNSNFGLGSSRSPLVLLVGRMQSCSASRVWQRVTVSYKTHRPSSQLPILCCCPHRSHRIPIETPPLVPYIVVWRRANLAWRSPLSARSRLSTHANTRSENGAIFVPIVVKFINLLFMFTCDERSSFSCQTLYLVPRRSQFRMNKYMKILLGVLAICCMKSSQGPKKRWGSWTSSPVCMLVNATTQRTAFQNTHFLI